MINKILSMTNEEISDIVTLNMFYKVITDGGDTFIGIIDGPYKGINDAILAGYDLDYFYITLVNSQQQIIKVFSHNITKIEAFEV